MLIPRLTCSWSIGFLYASGMFEALCVSPNWADQVCIESSIQFCPAYIHLGFKQPFLKIKIGGGICLGLDNCFVGIYCKEVNLRRRNQVNGNCILDPEVGFEPEQCIVKSQVRIFNSRLCFQKFSSRRRGHFPRSFPAGTCL